MCRIAGLVSRQKILDNSLVESMLASMKRGGPDDTGVYSFEQVCFGHNRLAIIDVSKDGHQPMESVEGDIVLTFNGEIYNYKDIIKKLQLVGPPFNTGTDTEVIIRAYEYWGIKCVSLFEGIFAFSLYDKKNGKVFIVRDYPGVKPMYYSLSDSELLFSSEAKAFKTVAPNFPLTKDWEVYFLAFGFLPHPYTTYDGVFELAPGSILEINLSDFSVVQRVFFEQENASGFIKEKKQVFNLVKGAVESSVRKNLISDAPLGLFLSGGLDSSLITLLVDQMVLKVKTISVNFDEAEFDESRFQREVLRLTKHVEHTSHRISKEMFFNELPDYWKALDQPTVDGVNAFFITKCAHDEGLKAVLSGIGADEMFGGYHSFRKIFWMKLLKVLPYKRTIANFLGKSFKDLFFRISYLELGNPVGDYLFLRGIFCPMQIAEQTNLSENQVIEILNKVLVKSPYDKNHKHYFSFLDAKLYMRNQLLRDFDFMGMWHGIEVRVPFLDIMLLKTLDKIDQNLRLRRTKYLLKTVFSEILPRAVIVRRKKGFTFPFVTWLVNSSEELDKDIVYDKSFLKVRDNFLAGKSHWSKLWVLIVRAQFKRLNTTQNAQFEFLRASVLSGK